MKPIRITSHALGQATARKVETEFIERSVREPEQIVPDEDDEHREIYQSRFVNKKGKAKLLRVVVEESEKEITVVTVYATSKVKKYWRAE